VSAWIVLVASLAYVGLLFAIAWHGDRVAQPGRRAPLVYGLSLAVYCTAWTFYGSVGVAAHAGFAFLPIYLGPILMLGLGWPVLAKMVRIAKQQNTVSIADFIAARYGKSQAVAALVTVAAVLGITPYIGLQLKAVSTSYEALVGASGPQGSVFVDTALYVTALMAAFTILFGLRSIEANEHHRGLMRAIAFESVVKLAAFLAVGVFVTLALLGGPGTIMQRLEEATALGPVLQLDWARPSFWTTTLVAAFAILCLPRQFHVSVVENVHPADVRWAAWIFPLYLVVINLFVVPVAAGGLLQFASADDGDTFMVLVPQAAGAPGFALLAFLGGLSAATGMVIVAAVALSTMISNDLALPLLLRRGGAPAAQLLSIRRSAAVVVLSLGYLYHRLIGETYPLASIGIVSFVAVAQFAPAMLGGLYWLRGNRAGALAGIGAGFALWAWTLVLPTATDAGLLAPALLSDGPWGLAWLRPRALFGLAALDPLSHSVVWSLGVNLALYVAVSLVARAGAGERQQAEAFVLAREPRPGAAFRGPTTVGELVELAAAYVGADRAREAFRRFRGDGEGPRPADLDTVRFTERLLAGAIGSASARVAVAGSLQRKALSRKEALAMLDEASHAIRFSHELLTATVENVTQGICVFDKELRLATWNRHFFELNDLPFDLARVGTSIEEIVGYNTARGEYEADGAIATLLERCRRPLPWDGPDIYERRRPDGTVLETAINPMPEGGFVVTYTDVTERHRAASALRQANESLERRVAERTEALQSATAEAERANLGKTRFLAAASHDLLQPLHAARLFTSALLERRPDELAGQIDSSLRSVEALLRTLLDVSKLDGGAVKPELADVALGELLATLAREFAPIAGARGLRLDVVATRAVVRSDPALLRRILQNLLSNAIRYTERGRVLVGCRRAAGELRIEVWDTGPGIPEDKRDEIFEEFRRLHPGGAAGERGLGLGLAIVERIARVLGTRVEVRSEPGRGSCFSVAAPLAIAASAAPRPPVAAPQRTGALEGALILCIDNEPVVLDGMRALLAGWGCEVAAAASVEEAWPALQGCVPDAIVVDYRLDGGRTGIDALEALAARLGRGIPEIVVTADHGEAVREATAARGCSLLYKPVRPAALRALLSRFYRRAA
jgi:Na+/proline symporter/signal transduction histidine kinase/CheY-like chemotaxis protein